MKRVHEYEHSHLEHHNHWSKEEWAKLQSYEALDYDVCENSLYTANVNAMSPADVKNIGRFRWFLFALTGFFTGLSAFTIAVLVKKLIKLRFNHTVHLLEEDKMAAGYFYFCGLAVAYILIGTLLINFVQPAATGSGLPKLKAYLNGVNIPDFLQIDTLVCKVIGVIFAVASGITCGKEGPLVHTGSCVASRLSHMPRVHALTGDERAKMFRADHERRGFVSAGAAAGVAAAFGAPIGGVLFSLEEASSFWSLPLTWGVFFTAMISTFTVNILMSAKKGNVNDINSPGLITFGSFVDEPYQLYELFIYVLLGIIGGLLGALFNYINVKVNAMRIRFLPPWPTMRGKIVRVLESCMVAFVTATLFYWVPYASRHICKDVVETEEGCNAAEQIYEQYLCDDGQYNSMATLMLKPQEEVIEALFHDYKEPGEYAFRIGDLLLYFVIYFCISSYTYGITVPAGLFVPCIICGSAYGRIVGELVQDWTGDEDIQPGTYALLGATSMLGGVTRMTISLTVIMLETTNNIKYLLPIMLVLMISKFVGDWFNISLYDMHVQLDALPFVESHPPKDLSKLYAKDVMKAPVKTLPLRPTVATVTSLLNETSHNGFPVVDAEGHFLGIILRNQLCVLINARCFRAASARDVASKTAGESALPNIPKLGDFASSLHSKTLRVDSVIARTNDDAKLDLFLFMNPAPVTVQECTRLSRVYQLYRSMGIRHLAVVDRCNVVVGILTRQELHTDFSLDLY